MREMNLLDYRAAGDRGVLINFGNTIDDEIFARLLSFERELEENPIPGIRETVKGFCTLFIAYDPLKVAFPNLLERLRKVEEKPFQNESIRQRKKVIEIPAIYGGAYGPDLPLVASLLNISKDEVIRLHLAHDYWVYINGAIGGMGFFKGIGRLFDLPRKKTPALFTPPGSIPIAAGMGGVFKAIGGPSGWYNIAQSPLRQWYPDRNPPVLIKTGDWVRYRKIDEREFQEIKNEVERDTYQLKFLD
jgi:inhibitor of KinA